MNKLFLIITFFFVTGNVFAGEFLGLSKVIDGDTIYINYQKFRLEGIDAPEIRQLCEKKKKEYFCGRESKNKLITKIGTSIVRCVSSGKDKYKRHLATCFIRDVNLNKWMVRQGYAVAYKRYSKKYIDDEDFAKKNKLGIWSGTFMPPEKWRKLN